MKFLDEVRDRRISRLKDKPVRLLLLHGLLYLFSVFEVHGISRLQIQRPDRHRPSHMPLKQNFRISRPNATQKNPPIYEIYPKMAPNCCDRDRTTWPDMHSNFKMAQIFFPFVLSHFGVWGHFEVWMHIRSCGPISVKAVWGHFGVYDTVYLVFR